MTEAEAPEITPERRQKAALAVLSTPVLHHMGLRPGTVTRNRLREAESIAMLEGHHDVVEWARGAFRTRGPRKPKR